MLYFFSFLIKSQRLSISLCIYKGGLGAYNHGRISPDKLMINSIKYVLPSKVYDKIYYMKNIVIIILLTQSISLAFGDSDLSDKKLTCYDHISTYKSSHSFLGSRIPAIIQACCPYP